MQEVMQKVPFAVIKINVNPEKARINLLKQNAGCNIQQKIKA